MDHILIMVLLLPLIGGITLVFLGRHKAAPEINTAFSLATFVASVWLAIGVMDRGAFISGGDYFMCDPLNVMIAVLTAFVGLTTALYSRPYMRVEIDNGRMTPVRLRIYHSMFQFFTFTMMLALLSNNIGVMWVALEAATLTVLMLVSIYRTVESVEAAWKYFILSGVGIALALLGTILVYLSAERYLGRGSEALLWTNLQSARAYLEPSTMALAFAFIMVGYGTKLGLVPMHSWLPDAHAEGPTPISAVLSGLLLNVALNTVVRFKVLADGTMPDGMPGKILIGFGLVSVMVAAFLLARQKDVKRMFSYSSIEHVGIMTFTMGIGGPIATYAALLHMTAHSLIKSSIFFCVGHACQKAGTQVMADIRGLAQVSPTVGAGLLIGAVAILGLPPFGVFASEFLIVTTAVREAPIGAAIVVLALCVAFATVLYRVMGMVFGETTVRPLKHSPAILPVVAHMGLALVIGLYIPPFFNAWLVQAVHIINR